MTSVPGWRAARVHSLVIALLYALVIPVAVLDNRDLHGGGGGWISLDLRGLYVGAYLIGAGLLATILLVHMSVKKLGRRLSFALVVVCSFPATCLVPVGYLLYRFSLRAAEESRVRKITNVANTLADAIQVRWWLPRAAVPTRFELELTSRIAVDVESVSVSGYAASQLGSFISVVPSARPAAFRLEPGVTRRMSLSLDREPTPDTYWSIDCSLRAAGTTVSVGWVNPGESPNGGDAVRYIPLH